MSKPKTSNASNAAIDFITKNDLPLNIWYEGYTRNALNTIPIPENISLPIRFSLSKEKIMAMAQIKKLSPNKMPRMLIP